MSLLDTPIWEVIKGSFAPDIWVRLVPAVGETLYMTVVSSIIMLVFGLLLGILLTVTNPDGLVPMKILYTGSGWLINALRSLPQMIMIILMIPVARLFFRKILRHQRLHHIHRCQLYPHVCKNCRKQSA